MDIKSWQKLYDNISPIPSKSVIVGFNVNLDLIIAVTPELLNSTLFNLPECSELLSRLLHSMQTCTAEEWFVSDRLLYQQFIRTFGECGHRVIGGQAGISAVHLASMSISDVLCIAHSVGPDTQKIFNKAKVHLLDFKSDGTESSDIIHFVFEYPPGLVPVADGVIPRRNRFIASPIHSPESVLIPDKKIDVLSADLFLYNCAFLSGYQYLQTDDEFQRAAEQILLLKKINSMRIHVECVSVTDTTVINGFIRYILPVVDSIGLNEHELVLLLHCLNPQNGCKEILEKKSPVQQVNGALEISKKSGLKRLHLHTFGYYVLIVRNDCVQSEISLNALLFASRTVANAAQGTISEISQSGIVAYEDVEKKFGPQISPGIFRTISHTIVMIPTLIAKDISKSSGLGDILSSSAFVADQF